MSTKNLDNQEAITKLKELAESIDFAMLCTDLGATPFHAIPMSTKKVDDQGHIWFLSGQDSSHNQNIQREAKVEVLYANSGTMQFLSVFGEAAIRKEPAILKELYQSTDNSWFSGVDDPNLTAIEVAPLEAHYWDVKGNKLTALLKLGWGGLTGERPDYARQGDLKV